MVFNWFRELFGVFLGFGVTTQPEVEIIAGDYPRASKRGISSARCGCFQRNASSFSDWFRISKEVIPLTERSNLGGPPTTGALACRRAENKDEAGQAAQKGTARLVGQIV